MPKIFICYRREDSKWPAQLIYNHLVDHYGSESVVFDVDTIPLGTDFREYLNQVVSKCDILLAAIGDQWLEILEQRLDQPNDFVRIEIQTALERKIPVVPVLVGRRPVPSEKDLPTELAGLSYRHATEVRAGADLQVHLKRLVDGLDCLLPEAKALKKIKQAKQSAHKSDPKTYKNSIGMKFVLIPSGLFKMGSTVEQTEMPAHEVKISHSFYLQTTQVTQGQWIEVMGNNPSKFKDCEEACPVEKVSWDDVQNFIKKLNEKEDTGTHRLPTEAEWEYACRAGTTTDFSYGDDVNKLREYAWFKENSKDKTHPSGTKKPNAWGLYDMHGNVWEWVEDDWHYNYEGSPIDGRAWIDEPRRGIHGIRGGGWHNFAWGCRSAIRYSGSRGFRKSNLGFRLARPFAPGS